MALTNNGGAPGAGLSKWQSVIIFAAGLAIQALVLVWIVAGWRATTEAALGDHTRRIDLLERSDRDSVQVPAKLEEIGARITRLEVRDEEARRADRLTFERIVRVEGQVSGVSDQIRQLRQEVLDARMERRQTGQAAPGYVVPPSPPPSSPASQRPGDQLRGFRQ